jgi:uncharacterized paraquat-inducible protein A
MVMRIIRFLFEWTKWKMAGSPLRPAKQIEHIFNICSDCDEFDYYENDKGLCTLCECNIKKYDTKVNKAAWGTTRCPIGRW